MFYFQGFNWRLASVIICFFYLFPASLSAQTVDSNLLKTVVIQATRTGANAPVPHNNYSSGQIDQIYQVQDIPFLLTAIPSLVESSDAGAGVGYTGMRIRGSDPSRINVTINGVPLNDAESQGVFWVDLPDLAASATEIQVQRGVGASSNGAGAFGATVNLDISKVQAEPYATLTNSLGSFGTRKHSASVGTGLLAKRFAFSGRLSQIRSDGYVDRASADLHSYHFLGAYVDEKQTLQAHLLSGHELSYQAWNGLPAQYLEVDSLRTFNTAGTEKPGVPHPNEVDDYTQRHFLLHYKRQLKNGLLLQLNGHYTRGFGFYEQYKSSQPFNNYGLPEPQLGDTELQETDLIRRRWLDNHFYGGTYALRWEPAVNPPLLASAPVLLLGGAFSRYEGKHFGELIWGEYAIPTGFRYYNNDANKQDANLFGKIDLHFRKGLSTFIDLQYRHIWYTFLGFDQNRNNVEQSAKMNFFNPKLGLNWTIQPQVAAYAFWGVGHREPNRDDFTQSTPASRPRAERLFDWEAGLRINKAIWTTTINFFYMDYRDQLILDGRINDVGAYTRTNVPRSFRAGLEVETCLHLHSAFRLSGSAAFSKNKAQTFTAFQDNWDSGEQDILFFKNTDLAFSPNIIARVEASWSILPKHSNHQLGATISGKYVGRQYLDNTSNAQSRLNAYFFSDLRFNYDLKRFLGQKVCFILAINNVLDAHYVSNGWVYRFKSEGYDERPDNPYTRLEADSVYQQAGFFPQAGRHIMGTLRVEF